MPSQDEQTFAGLPELIVGGLSDEAARDVLGLAIVGGADELVVDRIIAEARGNPLALLELPRELSVAELAGGFGVSSMQPLSARLERSFLGRVRSMPEQTQRFLLLAAAEPAGDPALLMRAAELVGLGVEAAAPAEAVGLIELAAQVRFQHPLVRSAIYRAAPLADRQAVHRALAEATDTRQTRIARRGTARKLPAGLMRISRLRLGALGRLGAGARRVGGSRGVPGACGRADARAQPARPAGAGSSAREAPRRVAPGSTEAPRERSVGADGRAGGRDGPTAPGASRPAPQPQRRRRPRSSATPPSGSNRSIRASRATRTWKPSTRRPSPVGSATACSAPATAMRDVRPRDQRRRERWTCSSMVSAFATRTVAAQLLARCSSAR